MMNILIKQITQMLRTQVGITMLIFLEILLLNKIIIKETLISLEKMKIILINFIKNLTNNNKKTIKIVLSTSIIPIKVVREIILTKTMISIIIIQKPTQIQSKTKKLTLMRDLGLKTDQKLHHHIQTKT